MNNFIFPVAFEERMKNQLGKDWPKFEGAHRQPAPTSIRINPQKSSALELERIAWTDFGYYLNERPSFTFDPLFHGGAYYVQEASSMFIEQALKQTVDLTKPIRVLDLCAAPGGKSTHLLSLLGEQSLLVANETIRARATVLAENICKWGNPNVVITNNDPQDFKSLNGFFDVILVDAPCSGEGLFRKDTSAINEWSVENTELCSLRQQRILQEIWPTLKENGILIYSTCTYSQKENYESVASFINNKRAKNLLLATDPAWGVTETEYQNVTGYQFFPHSVKGEGFFISVIQKTEKEDEPFIRTKKNFKNAPKEVISQLADWLKHSDNTRYIFHNDLVISTRKDQVEVIEFISERLRVIQKGTALCTVKHTRLIPEHALALSVQINSKNFSCAELSHEQAIAYLRKDSFLLASEIKGHTLITHQNLPIGWANHLGNRTNNLYPSEWRIRSKR